jgi:hypothetical protein
LLGPLQYLVLYRAIVTILRTADQQRRALRWLIALSSVVSLSAIGQQLAVPGFRGVLATLTGANLYGTNPTSGGDPLTLPPRASGVFPFWHETGGYLMIVVLLITGLLLDDSQRVLARRWLFAILLVDAAALVETVTIAPIIGAIVGAIAIGLWYRRSRVVLLSVVAAAAILGAVYFPLLQQRGNNEFSAAPGIATSASPLLPQTLAYRITIFKTQDIPLLTGRWLTGYGPSLPGNYAFPFTESLYFTMLLRGGLILLAIYLALMWTLAQSALSAMDCAESGEQLLVARVVMVVIVLLFFIHFIEGYFVDTGPADLIWVLAALLVRPYGPFLGRSRSRYRRPAAWMQDAVSSTIVDSVS